FTGEAATIRPVDQAGAREDEAPHGGGAGGAREALRADIVDRVRLLGRGAAEEGGAVDDGVDAAHRGRERAGVEEVALDELDTIFVQAGGACGVAYERAHLIAALGKASGESASDLSGRSGDEDFHSRNIASGARGGLEKPDKRASTLALPSRDNQNR